MKKILLSLCLILCISLQNGLAQEPKHEFRATWFTTVENIDWPKTYIKNASSRTQQQKELTDIFDKLVAGNMNAACMQVRSMCDAMYKSSYEPWSRALTEERGKDPGYDPLAFAVEEAHKRGLELHIWVNPFRVTSSGTISTSDKIWQNAGQWIIKYNNGSFSGQIIDPGYPEAREYVIKVLMEIINNYDVDGIVMDDYFYPYGGTTTEDADSKSKYKPNNVVDVNQDGRTDDDWRRSNVDACLKALYDTIQSVKPWVRFGMGSFGIWSTQRKAAQAYGLTLPSGISGLDDYEVQACNPVEWVKNGYVDYVNPQLYWSTNIAAQDYDVLCKWWAKDVCEHFSNQLPDGKKVHFFISQAAYHAYDGYKGYDAGVGEIQKQIDANRANLSSGYTGSVFYNTTAYCKMYDQLAQSHFSYKALPPAMDWKSKTALSAPTNLTISSTTLTWKHATASRFTLYVYPKTMTLDAAQANPIYLQRVVYGKSFNISGIDTSAYHIAVCAYDRFGVEHAAAIYTEQPEDPNPSDSTATQITWQLNGGVVESIPAAVPTNDSLWTAFKPYYNEYYNESRSLAHGVKNVATFAAYTMQAIMTDPNSAYKWLGDYILSVVTSQGYVLSTDMAEVDEKSWRWHAHAFFNCNDGTVTDNQKVAAADFSTAGQPSAWGSAYQQVHTIDTLPTYVDSDYLLPIPTHPKGYDFLGWYDNAAFLGSPLTSIPAYWAGTLYAKWDIVRIHWHLNGGIVENIPMPAPAQEQLWAEFKVDANITMLDSLSTIKKEDRPMNTICLSLLADNVTTVYALSKWSWLKSYIQDVQHAQVGEIIVGIDGTTRTVAELNDDINATNATSTQWRYSTAAFFVQMQYDKYPATADFSTAGQPSVWGKVYQQTHTTNVLPKLVYTTYVLPTPTHPQGYTFLGWSTNAEGTNFVTEINETFEGALYAIWQQQGGVGTSVDQVVLTPENAQMYDLLGRPVGQNYKGIVIQNGKKYLLK